MSQVAMRPPLDVSKVRAILIVVWTTIFLESISSGEGARGTVLLHRIANTAASKSMTRRRNVAVSPFEEIDSCPTLGP